MSYEWKWGVLAEPSPTGDGSYLHTLWVGLGWTAATTLLVYVICVVVGTAVGIMRTRPSRSAQLLGRAYVEIFRNIPVIVQLFLWYFVLPEILPKPAGDWLKSLDCGPFVTAVLGIALYMAARVAEQVRSGILALPPGQAMAAAALGMTTFQIYRYVLLPRAFRTIWPALTTDAMNTVKITSVALTIGLPEMTFQAHAMQEYTFQVFEPMLCALIVYCLLNALVVRVMLAVERAIEMPGFRASR